MQSVISMPRAQQCSLGCPILDKLLNGGIPCKFLTELVGENASAKTQLCLQLLLTVQLPVAQGGLDGSAVYVYTENYFPSSRLHQLGTPQAVAARLARMRVRSPLRPLDENIMDTAKRGSEMWRKGIGSRYVREREVFDAENVDPLKNVFVQSLQTAEQLLAYLDHFEFLLSSPSRKPVRLLVIDSIAALFRAYFDNSSKDIRERSVLLFTITSRLRKIAEKYNLAVVVTNQVTDYFEPEVSFPRNFPIVARSDDLITSGRRIVPALGTSWASCVNIRLFLSRKNDNCDISIRRSMHLVFAPHLPNVSCNFALDVHGVKGLPPAQYGAIGLPSKRKHADTGLDEQYGYLRAR